MSPPQPAAREVSVPVPPPPKPGPLTTAPLEVREVWGDNSHAILFVSAACCDASPGPDGKVGTGDPAELALLRAALTRGIRREDIEKDRPRVAGVRTEMMTGDSPETAQAIGRELGILRPGENPAERIHARVTAEDTLRIVRRWKERVEEVVKRVRRLSLRAERG